MRKTMTLLTVAALLLLPAAILAADTSPHRVHITVVDAYGQPYDVPEIGCARSDDPIPTNYDAWVECTDCSEALCVFPADDMRAAEGAYIVRPGGGAWDDGIELTMAPDAYQFGQMLDEGDYQLFAVWWTNETGSPWDWETIHEATFEFVDIYQPPTPPPAPTYTPMPTPTPPMTTTTSVEMLSVGFDNPTAFVEAYEQMSSAGIAPAFGVDHSQWLFYARKTIEMVNRGNLLYVVGGMLMAGTVLGWAIDQVRNPR